MQLRRDLNFGTKTFLCMTSGIDVGVGTNISLYRGYVLYSAIYLGCVFLFFCVGKASHDAIETLEAGGFACCSGI